MSAFEGESSDSMWAFEGEWVLRDPFWSYSAWGLALNFQFLDGVRPDPKWSSVGSGDGQGFVLLRKALSFTTTISFSTEPDYTPQVVADLLSKVLKTDDSPLPVLCKIWSWDRRMMAVLLEAAKAGKVPQLTTLEMMSACEVGDLRLLTDAVSAGNLPFLSALGIDGARSVGLSHAIESLMISLDQREIRLTSLKFDWCTIGSAGHLAIARVLAGGHMSEFRMRWPPIAINHACLEAYTRALGSGRVKALTDLHLDSNGIDDEVVGLLSLRLKTGDVKGLRYISLYGNKIGDNGMAALASLWKENLTELRTMHLHNNQIGDDGIIALASLFKDSVTGLKSLELGLNRIGDKGIVALSSLLKGDTWPQLEYLGIEKNPISEKGFLSLSDTLKSGQLNSLKRLSLSTPSKDSFKAIVTAFDKNQLLVATVLDNSIEHNSQELKTELEYLRTRNQKHVTIENEMCGPNVQSVLT